MLSANEPAHSDDASLANSYIAPHGCVAVAVVDPAIANDEVDGCRGHCGHAVKQAEREDTARGKSASEHGRPLQEGVLVTG